MEIRGGLVGGASKDTMEESLAAFVEERHGLSIAGAAPVRGAGDECEIWRLPGGGGHAVRVSPASRSAADLEWMYRVVECFATAVPEAVAPLRSADDRAVGVWKGRPVSAWPWIEGAQLDRDDAEARRQAAELLGRLHSAAEELGFEERRPRPVPWCARCPHWEDLNDPALDAALLAWKWRARSRPVPLHGDFYRRNLIRRDGVVAGVLDWDELRVDLPERELAWATWELAKHPSGDAVVVGRVRDFLDAYAGAGRRTPAPADLVTLIREGLRAEICRNRTERGPGAPDDDYTAAEVRAFRDLRDAVL